MAIGNVIGKKAVAVDSRISPREGDEVIVAIDEGLVPKASLLLYVLPLLAMFMGAGLAEWLLAGAHAELWTAGGALFGLLLSMWLINRCQKLFLTTHRARPIMLRKR